MSTKVDDIVDLNDLIIVDYKADWCGPCRKISPIMKEIEKENSRVTVVEIDTDTDREMPTLFGIRSLPSIMFFKRGNKTPVAMMIGAQPKKNFEEKISLLLA